MYTNGGGTTTLTNCTVSGNAAHYGGGLLSNYGLALTLTGCTVSGNTADGGPYSNGAGVAVARGGTDILTNCTISGNSALGDHWSGGMMNFYSTASLDNCTISGNSASSGGGLTNDGGTTTLTDCTVSGNTAGNNGGGLYNISGGTATLYDCTISQNSASNYGGGVDSNATTTLGNTIVAGNTANTGPDVNGVITTQGNNLIGESDDSSGWFGSDLTGTIAAPLDPMLGPLANNGGPTQTMALLPSSPAIDAGNNALIPSGITTDQRGTGYPRVVNGTVDIGAVEFGSTVESQTISFGALANQTYGATPVNLTATASSNLPVSFAIISGPATISGTVLTITGAGTVEVEAQQGGNSIYAQATPVDETFTVSTRTLTIMPAAAQSKVYGAAVPVLTETATGFVNGDSASLLTGTLGTTATASSAVGTYAFTLGSLGAGPNYTLVLSTSSPTLAVTPATLTIQPKTGQSKVYGAAVPVLTETATGFVNGDSASLLTGLSVRRPRRAAGSATTPSRWVRSARDPTTPWYWPPRRQLSRSRRRH